MNVYQGISAATGEKLIGDFNILQLSEVDEVVRRAEGAYHEYQSFSNEQKAIFLEKAAEEILGLGDFLIERAMAEAGLPRERITAERGRTIHQLNLFAKLIRKGEWVEASIDTADLNCIPAPKPDLRKQLEPLGPVVVFGASNFPLAYSAGGGDTASALAAGCSVIVKGHPAHPGTSEMVANAIISAAENTGMPKYLYQHVHDTGLEIGVALVEHPLVKAVGFTGSLKGGRALFDLANRREIPIPVFAEMGSINPVVLLPDAIQKETKEWGLKYGNSILLSCGQFCTNPGLIIGLDSPELQEFLKTLTNVLSEAPSQQMLNDGISTAFSKGKREIVNAHIATIVFNKEEANERLGGACIAMIKGVDFIQYPKLQEELFGPFSLIVSCSDMTELHAVVKTLKGQLTGSVIATKEDLVKFKEVVASLKSRVGRLVFNGVPTGVEVATAMNHGGPYPATTDSRFTAVGPGAIKRFSRPVSYQNCPNEFLPKALNNENELGIYRTVNGELTKNRIS